jgi:hypothetical protein
MQLIIIILAIGFVIEIIEPIVKPENPTKTDQKD